MDSPKVYFREIRGKKLLKQGGWPLTVASFLSKIPRREKEEFRQDTRDIETSMKKLKASLMMPIRSARTNSDKPADIASFIANTAKFLQESRAYDRAMKALPAESLDDTDQKYIKDNENWFKEDSKVLAKDLERLQAWVKLGPEVASAPENVPQA